MTRDEAVEAGARALDPAAWDDTLWSSATGWGLLAQPSRKAEARSVVATVLNAVGWRPEAEVKAEALRDAATDLRSLASGWPTTSGYVRGGLDVLNRLSERADALGGAE